MRFFDTHCHLTDTRFEHDLDTVIENAHQQGVKAVLTIGTGPDDTEKALSVSRKLKTVKCFVAAGLSPFEVKDASMDDLEHIEILIKDNKEVIAVGEIGLDRYHGYSDPDKEERFFSEQLLLASKLEIPAVIHSREAHPRTKEILQEYADALKGRAVIHCFSGTYTDACAYLDMGFSISFTCSIGYKNQEEQRNALKKVPITSVMAETDAPYLPPVDKRGMRNEPFNVCKVIEIISEIKGIPLFKAGDMIFENSTHFFGIEHDSIDL